NIAAYAPGAHEFIFDRRAVVRQHAAEGHGQTSVAQNRSQETDVFPDRLKRARRIEQHEPIFKHQPDALERVDRLDVLFDGDLFVQRLETLFAAGFETHVNEIESGVAHADEQLAIDRVGAAVHLPDDLLRQTRAVQLVDKLVGPTPPHLAE